MSKAVVCGLFNFWCGKPFLPYCLENYYSLYDQIICVESVWVDDPRWNGDTSPDGSYRIVEDFIKEHDTENKMSLIKVGKVRNQPEGRNAGLHLVRPNTDWIILCDIDEFFFPEDLIKLREFLELPQANNYSSISILAKVFYFDATYYKREHFSRGFRWFPGQQFFAIASMYQGGRQNLDTGTFMGDMMHMSYCGQEHTLIKACQNEDLPKIKYDTWYENIFSKFNKENLEDLYSKNSGGIHVCGGGQLDRYYGPYPKEMMKTNAFIKGWEKS